jgi:hypothetical protein
MERVRMTALQAWREGIRRVASAPGILAGVWLMTVLVGLPPALALRGEISAHLGSSLAADSAANGVNYEWMQEFADQATGVGATLRPTILGFAAVLDNLSAFLDATPRPILIVATGVAYVALWLFVAGGILDRYARDRATGVLGFFSASGVFFFRFLRLGIPMLAAYGVLFGVAHPWLFDRLYPLLTRDVTVERTAFLIRVALYLVFGLLLGACNLVFDYAKVRAVVEDRRSAFGALAAGLRFVRRNPGAAIAVYALDLVLFALTLAVYALLAPSAGGVGWTMWVGFIIGQAYILGRLAVKLIFWASETALFQGRLAHAGYVAAAAPAWPDSPAAEAVR